MKRSARRESQLMFTRRRPAAASASAWAASSMPLVVSARSSNPRAARPGDQLGEPFPHQRLAAGEPDRGDPEAPGHAGHPDDLVEREQLGPGQEGHPLLGHAVGAAEIAAIGHRDAQSRRGHGRSGRPVAFSGHLRRQGREPGPEIRRARLRVVEVAR